MDRRSDRELGPGVAAIVGAHHRSDGRGRRPGFRRLGRQSRAGADGIAFEGQPPGLRQVSGPGWSVDLTDVPLHGVAVIRPAEVGVDPPAVTLTPQRDRGYRRPV